MNVELHYGFQHLIFRLGDKIFVLHPEVDARNYFLMLYI